MATTRAAAPTERGAAAPPSGGAAARCRASALALSRLLDGVAASAGRARYPHPWNDLFLRW